MPRRLLYQLALITTHSAVPGLTRDLFDTVGEEVPGQARDGGVMGFDLCKLVLPASGSLRPESSGSAPGSSPQPRTSHAKFQCGRMNQPA